MLTRSEFPKENALEHAQDKFRKIKFAKSFECSTQQTVVSLKERKTLRAFNS